MTQPAEQAEHFWELPYSERRKIVFIKPESLSDKLKPDWKTILLYDIVVIEHVLESLRQDLKFAQPIPVAWADEFVLPPGHPRADVLYVAHPRDERLYIPAGDFHRYAFEQKFSEAVRLLMHLGATTLQVYQKKGWGHEFAAHLSAPLPAAEANVKAGAEKKKRKTGVLLYDAELEGTDEPALPEDGLLWYPHEPTWQNVAEGRLKFGLKSFSLTIHYTDDYGVNAELAAKVADAGVEMGGNFDKHEETIWRITGTFG